MIEITKLLGTADQNADAKLNILERAGLVSRDPAAYPGLSLSLNPVAGLDARFKPVAYDTRKTTGQMVHCSICPQRQEHYDGAIVRLKDGKIGLVGNSCGKRHFFGEDGWVAVVNRWSRESERALFLARFGTAKEEFAKIDRMLGKWVGELGSFNAVRKQLKVSAPKLFLTVAKVGSKGVLFADREMEVTYRRADGKIDTRKVIEQEAVCRIQSEWFFQDRNLASELTNLRSRLSHAASLLSADATSQNVTAVKRLLRECRDGIEGIAALQERAAPLTTASTLKRLADWANECLRHGTFYGFRAPLLLVVQKNDTEATIDLSALPKGANDRWQQIRAAWPSL